MVFQQLSHPLFFWDIQHNTPAELPLRNTLLVVFNAVTAGNTDIIPQKSCEVGGVSNFRFFLGQLQFQGFRQEVLNICLDLFRILSASDNTDDEVIRVPAVMQAFVAAVAICIVGMGEHLVFRFAKLAVHFCFFVRRRCFPLGREGLFQLVISPSCSGVAAV